MPNYKHYGLEKIIIAAVTKNGVIGAKGKLPWKSSEEMEFFKNTTTGFPVIMGRKTFQSLSKPLENRTNIVISKSLKTSNINGALVFGSLNSALSYCEKKRFPKVFIIGGEQIFAEAMEIADKMLISEMKGEFEGDTFFPPVDKNKWVKKFIRGYSDFDLYEYIPTED